MPRYKVTVTYTTIVDDAKNESYAEYCALYDVGSDPYEYTHIEIKEMDTSKCDGLIAHTCVVEEVVGPSDLYEDRMHLSGIKDRIGTLESFKNYLEEYKGQQEKILNALERLD